jgi:hypothetical protein
MSAEGNSMMTIVVETTSDTGSRVREMKPGIDTSAALEQLERLAANPDTTLGLTTDQTAEELLVAIDQGRFFVGWIDRTGVFELIDNDPTLPGGRVTMQIGGQQTSLLWGAIADRRRASLAIEEFVASARGSKGLMWTMK